MVTRRCTQRTFLLRPDRSTNNAFVYCLGLAAQRTDVELVAFLAMSNHWHGVVVDRAGRLPEFLECFHKLLAKHQNALRGRWENFWASEQTSVVELVEPQDVLAKVVYTLTNPTADHLVDRAHHWPGATSLRATLRGGVIEATRPRHFFRADGPCPPSVVLRMRRPPGFEHLTPEEFSDCLQARIVDAEKTAALERAKHRYRILGRARVLRQSWRCQPRSHEPRRHLDPRVACRNVWRRIETLARNKTFVNAYHRARDLWLAGQAVVFPLGTYWLRRFAGATCVTDPAIPTALSPPLAPAA